MVKDTTKSIHGHGISDSYGSIVPPIYVSAIYKFLDDEHAIRSDRDIVVKYSREENPILRGLERVIAYLEEADDSLTFTSGMAAISTTVIKYVKPGSKIVVPMELYSTTIQLLEELSGKLGFKLVKVWPSAESIVEAVDKEASMVLLEIMTNPTLKIIDLNHVCKSLSSENTLIIVDNTFTTPELIKPLKIGAHLVIHSLTKYLAGHNDVIGGAVAGSSEHIRELWDWRRMLGTFQQPYEAYLTLRGIKTFYIRFEKESESALTIAEHLLEHSKIEEVLYPGLKTNPYYSIARKIFLKNLYGAVLSFKIKGTKEDTLRFLKKLKIIKPAPSLGGTESLISIATAAAAKYIPEKEREKLGISENLLRLSVGLEDPNDLIEDINQALN